MYSKTISFFAFLIVLCGSSARAQNLSFFFGINFLDQQWSYNPQTSQEEAQSWRSYLIGVGYGNFDYSFEYGTASTRSSEGIVSIQSDYRRGVLSTTWHQRLYSDWLGFYIDAGVGLWDTAVTTSIGASSQVDQSKSYFFSRAGGGLEFSLWHSLLISLGARMSFGENLTPSPQLGWQLGIGLGF